MQEVDRNKKQEKDEQLSMILHDCSLAKWHSASRDVTSSPRGIQRKVHSSDAEQFHLVSQILELAATTYPPGASFNEQLEWKEFRLPQWRFPRCLH